MEPDQQQVQGQPCWLICEATPLFNPFNSLQARGVFSVLLAVLLCVFTTVTRAAEGQADIASTAVHITEPNPDQSRILGIRVGSYVLDDVVEAYAIDNSTYLPMGAIAQVTDMAIKVEPGKGIAQGFIFNEDRRFFLDIARHEVTISGKRYQVDPQKIRIYPDDIYVEADTFSKWMPFTIDVDLYASLFTIKSEEKLPFEQRIEREKQFKLIAASKPVQDKGYPGVIEPYSTWTVPRFTATLRDSVSSGGGQITNSANYSIHATNDLFKLDSSMYLAGNDKDPLSDARITLGRKDPENGLLGGLRASQFAFGHIEIGQSANITRSAAPQVGAFMSTYPLDKAGLYDRHTFVGELPSGWEVELYHNNALVGLARSDNTGQYRFEDIPLYFGNNFFRLVFYGPQGQRREETQSFNLSDLVAKPGQQFYSVQTTRDPDGGYQSNASWDRGISSNVSLHLQYDSLTLGTNYLMGQPAENRNYMNVGIKGLMGGMFISGDYVKDVDNGQLNSIGLQTRIGAHTTIGAKYTLLDNFTSERFPLLADPTKSVTEANLNTAVPKFGFLPRIPLSFTLKQDQFASGATQDTLTNLISASVYRTAVTNTLSYVRNAATPAQTSGVLQLSRSARHFAIRGDLNYLVQPTSDLSSAAITVDSIRAGNFILGFGLSHSLATSTQQFTARATRVVGKFAINADTNVSSTGSVTAGFGITVGVGREPRTPYWTTTAMPIAGMGAASVRVFLDNNDDGVFNAGDEPLPGIHIKRQGNPGLAKTNKDGILLVTNLPPNRYVDLEPNLSDLEDPMWVPSVKGVHLLSRPGATSLVDFPIIITGEIDGTTYLYANKRLRTVGDVDLQLINSHGKLVKAVKSASDGFYVISEVPIGEYLVRVAPEQVKELGLFEVPPIQIKITSKNQFVSGINFRLEKQ
ncbi:MAG: hypothetical protein ACWGOV_06220 [Acidiferrobacterales bacterium]